MTLDALNAMDAAAFEQALGHIYEHSPWVAARAAGARPFATLDALHAAMAAAVAAATDAERLALIIEHPDLAGPGVRARALEAASASEQARAGLDRLTGAEYARWDALNAAYRARFGFPFIIAAARRSRDEILTAFEARSQNDRATELRAALSEITCIARRRLEALLGDGR